MVHDRSISWVLRDIQSLVQVWEESEETVGFFKPVHIFVCTASKASARILLQMGWSSGWSLWLALLKTGIGSTTLCLHWPLHQQQQSKFGHLFRILLAESCTKSKCPKPPPGGSRAPNRHTPSEPQVFNLVPKNLAFCVRATASSSSPPPLSWYSGIVYMNRIKITLEFVLFAQQNMCSSRTSNLSQNSGVLILFREGRTWRCKIAVSLGNTSL